jgi:predicted aconitase with swiveling domain
LSSYQAQTKRHRNINRSLSLYFTSIVYEDTAMAIYPGRILVKGTTEQNVCPVIVSDVSLSFWGGIDEKTGVVIDQSHPLHGKCVAGSILVLPSGRGSCTASQVMLELILNKKSPNALVLRDRDGLVSVGALVAEAMFPEANVLDIIQVADYNRLLEKNPSYGQVLDDGNVIFGDSIAEVEKIAMDASSTFEDKSTEKRNRVLLTEEEQSMLTSAKTEAERRAYECVINYAHILSDNPSYIDVEKAHIDGTIASSSSCFGGAVSSKSFVHIIFRMHIYWTWGIEICGAFG